MKDVLLLTLHKQHYADKYEDELFKKNISCLGYYDEITISDLSEQNTYLDEQECRLSKKKSNAPMSAIWYGIGEQVQSLTGGYSNQNIGVFRSATHEGHEEHLQRYWQIEEKLPFFGIGFIKLDETRRYKEICKEIETENWRDEEQGSKCEVILYSTFENADLVILCKSNKWSLLDKVFNNIQRKPAVLYVHSILGIDEAYIDWCKKQAEQDKEQKTHEMLFAKWNNTRCFVEEKIKRIHFRIATCGSKDILEEIRYQWQGVAPQILGNITTKFSRITGHSDIELMLSDTNVATLITLLLPNGILTHTNPAYSKGMYNIETAICMQEDDWSEVTSNSIETVNDDALRNNCKELIKKYKELLEETDRHEEGLYSYYQALILTLNILIQYENFSMSRNIYDLIYPSFRIFDIHLRELWEKTKNIQDMGIKMQSLNKIKAAIEQYLDCVNSVIYHTIHTDQVYLMIPGYSGTFFSIPIKLSQFYMWFLTKVTEILNDGEGEYSCILMPVMETKPVTKEIEIEQNQKDKLICVKLSQRELYFPRNLMIILCHELGHYISVEPRCRKFRLDCLIESMSYTLVEGMIPEDGIFIPPQINLEDWRKYINSLKDSLKCKIFDMMKKEKKLVFQNKEYYSRDIIDALVYLSKKALSENDLGAEVKSMIYAFSQPIDDYVNEDPNKYVNRMRYIYQVQRQIDNNRMTLLQSDILYRIISDLVTIYKEVYSDIVAIKILQSEQDDFEESFAVSEGVIYENIEVPENEIRMTIAVNTFFVKKLETQDSQSKKIKWGTVNGGILPNENVEEYLCNNMYFFEWNVNGLLSYANMCKNKLEEYLKDKMEMLEDIRKVYLLFCNKEKNREEIYSEIVDRIENYKMFTESLQNVQINIDTQEI